MEVQDGKRVVQVGLAHKASQQNKKKTMDYCIFSIILFLVNTNHRVKTYTGSSSLHYARPLYRLCGPWCPAMYWKDDKKVRKPLKYRCKKKNGKLYLQLEMHHGNVLTKNWVRDLIHEFDSNKPESFNWLLTKFLSKEKHYCQMICNQGCTYLAINIDSVGYKVTFISLFTLLGVNHSSTATKHHSRLDQI
jgi:hypothetical protein